MRTVLLVEDGTEYLEAFERLAPATEEEGARFVRAGNLSEARALLARGAPDAVFLDVVFDRVREDALAGDLASLIARYGGDRRRAVRHLAENQGFYLLDALAASLPPGIPVVLAYDLDAEPQRLAALRTRVPGLVGLPDGASLSEALALLGC